MNEKKIFIVAGEASGDAHAARLIRALKAAVAGLCVEGLGGESMQRAGCELRADLASSAVMGFAHVIKNIRFFRRLLSETAEYIQQCRPDVLVLVDYPGFNLRLAAAAKKHDIPVVYYISPQVWAWRPKRIHKIARLVDKMIVILPFEEEIYRKAGVEVAYVGHPLLDSISEGGLDTDFMEQMDVPDPMGLIGLLPGSRKQEIRTILPAMIDTAKILLKQMPRATFLVPCSSLGIMELAREIMGEERFPVTFLLGKIYEVAKLSRCCIVASGTAALEVACFRTPLVVVYKTGHLTWIVGRRFLHVPHVSLVNILAGEEIVPEMLQYRMRPQLLADTVAELCREGERRQKMISDLQSVRQQLGTPGASLRAAEAVCELLERKSSAPMPAAAP